MKGASTDIVDSYGKTAIDCAQNLKDIDGVSISKKLVDILNGTKKDKGNIIFAANQV